MNGSAGIKFKHSLLFNIISTKLQAHPYLRVQFKVSQSLTQILYSLECLRAKNFEVE